ncbi:MAG: ChaB family protein [Microcoleus sp.]
MPYNSIDELPDSVRLVLPTHAQIIYKEAFNHAFEQYKHKKDRQKHVDREEAAHQVAWAAVKDVYKKGDNGKWHEEE